MRGRPPGAPRPRPRTFILPTPAGLVFLGTCLVLFLFAMFFERSLAYAAAFLLLSILLMSLFATNANMGGVFIDPSTRARQHGYGDAQSWTVLLGNRGPGTARTVSLGGASSAGPAGASAGASVDVPPAGSRALALGTRLMPGRHRLDRLSPRSSFPFGLFRAWRREPADVSLFVAPARRSRAGLRLEDFRLPVDHGDAAAGPSAGDEFAGLREYAEGDPVARIDWRRSRPWRLLSRSYGGSASRAHLIDADRIRAAGAGRLGALEAASHLVHACEEGGAPYALRIGGETGPMGLGGAHWEAAVERLALAAGEASAAGGGGGA